MTIARDDRRNNARRLRALVRARSRLPALVPVGAMTLRAMLLAGTMLSAHAASAQNLPQGGQVVGGAATIAQPSANQMVINQSTQRAAINWQSFNIGSGNGVQFVQPSSSAIALNRVVGLNGPSQILGSLTANGQVYIVNPQGVVFGKGAMVNTGALLATTRDINPAQFMAGGNVTLSGGSTGNGLVKNSGTITTAPGGYVVLAGDRVVNKGTIDTPGGGRTVLAAGDQATVALSNGQLVNVTMNASVANATVKNSGVIKADGGKVVLSANGAGTVIGGAINLSGTVDVSSALAGDITVDAGPGGTVNATGATLKAVSTAGKGGNVTLMGDRVGLFNGSKVNVSGSTGGGTVLAGGGVQGKDAGVRNASVTVLDPSSSIDASATDKGGGGTVVLWSQDYTGFYGAILAKGGVNGGNGGWIETSSHDNLQAWGAIDVRAVLGTSGGWLLDPSNVTIAASANASANFNTSNGTWSASQPNATINVAALNSQLSTGTSVTITTVSANSAAGNININANIAKTGGGDVNLTLFANGSINDNGATISSTSNKLNVTMRANSTVTLADGSAFLLNGGTLNITGGLNASSTQVGVNIGQTTINATAATISGTTNSAGFAVNLFGGLNASGTSLTIGGTNGSNASVNFGGNVTAGDLTVTGTAKGNGSGIVVSSALNASGNLTLNGTTNASSNSSAGVLLTGSACSSGNVTINGTANNGIGINTTGTVTASGGNVRINGTSSDGRGARLSGTIAAAGTATICGSSDTANGLAVPGGLILSAAGGATLIGTANAANGVNIAAAINATGTPLLTINGTSGTGSGDFNGVLINATGTVNAANLTIIGRGQSTTDEVGGVLVNGTLNSVGDMVINGSANNGIAVNIANAVNVSGGNLTINGTATTGRGVRLSGSITASGTVNVAGSSNVANGIALPGNLTLAAGGGATFTGTANAANGINISGNLNATGTPQLTLNGTSTQNGNLTFYGVNVVGNLNVAGLTIIGRGLSASEDTGGVILNGSTVASGDVTINGSANNGTGVSVMGALNASSGNLTINGSSNTSRGVRLAGTVAASGTVDVTGSSNTAAGIGVADNLTLAAGGGATLKGTAAAANGINISGLLNATGTPTLTLNGTATSVDNGFYGVKISGTLNAANLIVNGHGLSAVDDVGGALVSGTVTATGKVVLNGNAGAGTGVNVTGTLNASGGNLTINGTSVGNRGVRLAGTIASSGSVDVVGTATGLGAAIGVASNLNVAAAGGAAFTGTANAANGINISADVNAIATPNLTLNGTTTFTDGGVYGVTISGGLRTGNLTVNGLGNLNATGNIGGTSMTGTVNASGNVTLNGRSGGTFAGVFVSGGVVTSGGNIVLNGAGKSWYGVNASGTLNAAGGTVTINGTSDTNTGVLLASCLTLPGSGGGIIVGSTNSGQAGVLLANGSVLSASGPLTVNATGGLEAAGCVSAGANVTLNANRITLNGANFQGGSANVVLQALDAASAMTINGTGGNFGNVASVVIGSSSQTATLNLAAPLTYAGAGNLSVVTGAADIVLNANVNASAGSGSVILSAGNGVPLNASQSNGNVTGGDVVVGSVSSLVAGSGGTVVIYSGNANSAAFAPLVVNGATSQTKSYATLAGDGEVCTSSALNLFYRVIPTAAVTLGNSAGTNVSKTYDGMGVALGYGATGGIDGDTVTLAMTGNLSASAPLTAGQALHAGNYTISQGNATFVADHNYAVSVANGSIVITPKALTVTSTADTKVFDGTASSSKQVTVDGLIAGDTLTDASFGQVFASPIAAGAGNSILLSSAPLTNASFASSTAGSWIGDYSITYTAASGTILPTGGGGGGTPTAVLPPSQVDGLASANVVALGSWLNSGGLQQNIPAGLSLNDNVLHLVFTTSSTGQPVVQASWTFFNSTYSGTINLPVNVSAPSP
jgi:filamentous hemagglutinin family protein